MKIKSHALITMSWWMQGGCIVVVLDYKYICNKPESKFLTGQAEGLVMLGTSGVLPSNRALDKV